MRRKAVTIRDVAKRAGVGVSTVSYVLNGQDQHVSGPTREAILAAVRELNYRPNAIARSMVKQKTAAIGLIIAELQNPLFLPITEGVEEVLRQEGYHILLASGNDVQSEISAIETLRAQQVDGFIFMSLSLRYPTEHLMHLHEEGVPFVVINRDLDVPEINRIQLDDYGAGRMATEHLIKLGHQRIGTIYGPMGDHGEERRLSAIERNRGWQEAMQAHGLAYPEHYSASGGYTYEGGYRAGKVISAQMARQDSEMPSALFVAADMMAMGALKAFHEAGVRIPQDLAIVTIGDSPFAAFTVPALTTLSLPVLEAGRIAARMLLDWIHAGKAPPPECITLNFSLKIRESCGANP